jgi:hypothetical protein
MFRKELSDCVSKYLAAAGIDWQMEDFEQNELEHKESFSQAEIVDIFPDLMGFADSPPPEPKSKRPKKAAKKVTSNPMRKKRCVEEQDYVQEQQQVQHAPMPPGMTVATRAKDLVFDLIAMVNSNNVTRSAWDSADDATQREMIRSCTFEVKRLREALDNMKNKVRQVVHILDNEERHPEFFEQMVVLSEMAGNDE